MNNQEYNWWQKILVNLMERYDKWYFNCSKNRHRWGYKLSKSGMVYMDDNQVPDELWECLDCGVSKLNK